MDKELYELLDGISADELMPAEELLEDIAESCELSEGAHMRIRSAALRKAGFEMKNNITMERTKEQNEKINSSEVKNPLGFILTSAASLIFIIGLVAVVGIRNNSNALSGSPKSGMSVIENGTADDKELSEATSTTVPENGAITDDGNMEKAMTETTTTVTEKTDENINVGVTEPAEHEGDIKTADGENGNKETAIREKLNDRNTEEATDEEKDAWFPDPEYDDPYEQEGTLPLVSPTELYRTFDMNGTTYSFASETNGSVYETLFDDHVLRNYIPNDSYIDEYMETVNMKPVFETYESVPAEVYRLKYIDDAYLLAVKFTGQMAEQANGDKYFLYVNSNHSYNSFAELTDALNFEKCAFGGQAVSRSVNSEYAMTSDYTFLDDETELLQMLLELDGERADFDAYGNVWETFFNAPLYADNLSFKWYSEGYVTVNAFGSETSYFIGENEIKNIKNYILSNSHSYN